jgi:plastocyanin
MIRSSPRIINRWTVVLVAGGVLAACGNASAQQLPTGSPQASATGAGAVHGQAQSNPEPKPLNAAVAGPLLVRAVNFSFQPPSLSVPVGTGVTFRNDDGEAHTFTADSGAFDSGVLSGGQSFNFTFGTAGTFTYHCNIHSSMRGTIVVGGAARPGTATQAPAPAVTGVQPGGEPEIEDETEHHGGGHGHD